jgi:hypothetical protein
MGTTDELLRQAQALVKQGRKADARPVLERIVREDDQNEQAWLWLSAVVDTLDDQRICLENVLMLNPTNVKAQKGLETIRGKLGNAPKPLQSPSNPVQPISPSNAPSPYDISPYDDPYNPFNAPSTFDTSLPNSSVDWARGSAPAYGSGKQVQEPTANDYDSWMAKLPLDAKASRKPEPTTPPPASSRQRGTSDLPPLDYTAADDQFNLAASPYNVSNDPFQEGYDFNDFGVPPAPPPPAPTYGRSNAAPAGGADFDFSGFDGPFSESTDPGAAYGSPAAPPSGQGRRSRAGFSPVNPNANAADPDETWRGQYGGAATGDSALGYGSSGTPSEDFDSFNVPGGYTDPNTSESFSLPTRNSGVRRSSAAAAARRGETSGERFKFNNRKTESGTEGKRSAEMMGLESVGTFSDDQFALPQGGSGSAMMAEDDLSSGVFGAAARIGFDQRGRKDANAPSTPQMPKRSTKSSAANMAAMTSVGAYQAIPADIQVKPMNVGRTVLVLLLLVLLNVASLGILLYVNMRGLGLF